MKTGSGSHNRTIGRWGEAAAAQYLTGLGWELIANNVRTPYGEIDLIARQADLTIFVEVKARTSATFGLPEEAVTARKLEHMIHAAEHYAGENGVDHWRIDVISVEGKPGSPPKLTHFEDIS